MGDCAQPTHEKEIEDKDERLCYEYQNQWEKTIAENSCI